jgi:ubiquinone/menaquinone biosynthesis C-methylase UbiE
MDHGRPAQALQAMCQNKRVNRPGELLSFHCQRRPSERISPMQPINPRANPTSYFINPEEAQELERLRDVDQIMTTGMGGVFPDGYRLPERSAVLDLACGPGGWAYRVAWQYPESKVIGVDISQKMINYARAKALAADLTNASFGVMDITQPLKFPDQSFDFVNARLISSFMPTHLWPRFVRECCRVCKPHGTIRLTEGEWIQTNSQACEQIAVLMNQVMAREGKSFIPGGRYFGAPLAIARFLRDVELDSIESRAYYLEFSSDLPEQHEIWMHSMANMYRLLFPFLKSVVSEAELEQLRAQAIAEMQESEFLGGMSLRSASGRKPR